MTIFADTFALIAFLNPHDTAHVKTVKFLDAYLGKLLTTEWVLIELADALSAPQARFAAIAFLRTVRSDPQFEVIAYSDSLYQAGFDIYANRPDKQWSLTDCISFAVMAQLGLSDALTADQHFVQAGYRAILK